MTSPPPGAGWRNRARAALGGTPFDLLVMGGGIVGCGVARDAALRGLRVALVEQDDFASGTSSRSSRLVHGGVRYLEHGHLHLVFESSRERRRLLRLAPHLVRPLAFTWPVYDGARVAQWKLLAGLTLYDALALFRNVGNHRRLTPDGVVAREPMLTTVGLVGGATYWDASTNDTRLTLANALGAQRAGAILLNHARVTSLVTEGGRAAGAVVRDLEAGTSVTVRARVVVSAVGPWTNALQPLEEGSESPAVLGSAGVHVAVPRERVGNRDAITLVAPQDGRVMFVLPAGTHAIIGTTETTATRGPDDVRATREEVRYLLDACNASFPAASLRDEDVVAAWSGIRPLAATLADGDAGSASREHTVAEGAQGVLWVTGGKLTTYRAMAEDVVDRACQALGDGERRGRPFREVLLPGGAMTSLAATEREVHAAVDDDEVARHLAGAYGSDWRDAWRPVRDDPTLAERIDPALPYTGADVVHAVEREMAVTLADILVRRTHMAFETRDQGAAAARSVVALLSARLGWDAMQGRDALERYERDAERIFGIVE